MKCSLHGQHKMVMKNALHLNEWLDMVDKYWVHSYAIFSSCNRFKLTTLSMVFDVTHNIGKQSNLNDKMSQSVMSTNLSTYVLFEVKKIIFWKLE